MRLLVLLLGFALSAKAGAALESAQAVLDCARANAPSQSFEQAAELLVSKEGTLQRRIVASFAGQRIDDGFMLNIGVKEPADVAGTAVLLRQSRDRREDMKLYLPALRRVRTVTGAMAGQDLLGTNFSYLDIKQVYGAFGNDSASMEPAQVIAGRQAFHLTLRPVDAELTPYQSLAVFIDQETCVPLLIRFAGEDGKPAKELEGDINSLIQLKERRLLGKYIMRNLRDGTQTALNLGLPEFDDRISRGAFNPSTFYDYYNSADLPE